MMGAQMRDGAPFRVKVIISWSGFRRFVHTDALILHLVIQE